MKGLSFASLAAATIVALALSACSETSSSSNANSDSPEVIDRTTLERGLEIAGAAGWASPTALVTRAGGQVALFEPNMVPEWLKS